MINFIKKILGKPYKKIYYYKNGNMESKYFFLKGDNLHNENGPAKIWYYTNGSIEEEYYILNNQLHREDGPAIILYNEKGKIQEEYYFLNGKEITDDLQIMVMRGLME